MCLCWARFLEGISGRLPTQVLAMERYDNKDTISGSWVAWGLISSPRIAKGSQTQMMGDRGCQRKFQFNQSPHLESLPTQVWSFLQQLAPSLHGPTRIVLDIALPDITEADEDRTMILAFDNKYRSLTRLDGQRFRRKPHKMHVHLHDRINGHDRNSSDFPVVAAVSFGQ